MKKTLILLFCLVLIFNKNFAQVSCVNADFSLGNFNYWTGSTGDNDLGNYVNITPGIVQGTTNSGPLDVGQQTIINAAGTDPNTGGALSVLPPGGTSCCRLGNANVGDQAERLEYSMMVNSSNSIFMYQYAVVLENPGHIYSHQPKFSIYVLNSAGNLIDTVCGKYEVVSSGEIPGFNTYGLSPHIVKWKDWTTVSIDLSPYIGQNISIQFTTYDCTEGGHYGYAYLACKCGSLILSQQCLGNSSVVSAPSGFVSYAWSTGQSTSTVTIPNPVSGDTITCVCTSVTGCTVTLFTVIDARPAVFNISTPPAICSGETATITVTDTTGINTYEWSTSETTPSITVSPTSTTVYTVTATAAGGCSSTNSAIVTVNQSVAVVGPDVTICSGESTTLDASASTGTGPLTYNWSNGLGSGPSHIITPSATNTYYVTVTSSGCTDSASVTVNVTNIPSVAVLPLNPTICEGSIELSATGATNYTWSPATGLSSTTGATVTASPSATTTYTVIGDTQGCTGSATVNVTVITISATANSSDAHCGHSDGSATATTSGTCPQSWSYLWNSTPAQNTITATNLPAGNYIITVSCASCIATATATVSNLPSPSVSITSITNTICGYANGGATASVSGGTPGYSYSWSNGQTGQNLTNVVAGTYNITITDANGCNAFNTVTITGAPGPSAIISSISEICDRANGSTEVTISGGSAPYTYLWSNDSTNSITTGLTAGNYYVTVTDNNGCTTSASVNVQEIPGPNADFSANPNVLSILDGPVSFIDNSSGTVVTWLWNFGDGSQNGSGEELNHDYHNTGTYLVTLIVTDTNECTDTTTETIIVKDIFTFYVPNAFTPDDDGINDYFFPQGENWDPNDFEMYIFDRWGNLIYRTNTVGDKWNGTVNNNGTQDDMLIDVYVYLIRVKELEGPKHEYIGRVTLVR